jgi:hypothetical protein
VFVAVKNIVMTGQAAASCVIVDIVARIIELLRCSLCAAVLNAYCVISIRPFLNGIPWRKIIVVIACNRRCLF